VGTGNAKINVKENILLYIRMFRKIFQPREILVSLCKRDVVYKIPLWEKIIPESVKVVVTSGYLEIQFDLEKKANESKVTMDSKEVPLV
jgi:hypothetical protein